jgi:hypothetical protein
MAIDPSRLYTALLNTGLQRKDNPLYQVIHDLIANLITLNLQTNSSSSGSVGPPGPTGPQGPQGLQGLQGSPILSWQDDGDNDSILSVLPKPELTQAQIFARVVLRD